MTLKPNPWHRLEVGMHGDYKYGAIRMNEHCGCSANAPCATLKLYYAHQLLPATLPNGLYRMRINAFGLLELEREAPSEVTA